MSQLDEPDVSYTLDDATVLSVRDLNVTFPGPAGADVPAVRGVSYSLQRGEVLGIVGESGSGKSVSSMAVMGLLPRSARISGSVRFAGEELLAYSDKQWTKIRGSRISMVFQDPLSALTPVYTVGDQIAEAITTHRDVSKASALQRAKELLDLVGIPNAAQRSKSFPHEFSGGMRQRVMIAMAVANEPDIIIADEPTTALDVTIQAQILEVFKTVQREFNSAVVLITHDLGVVAGFADRVAVMYAGKPVEIGTTDEIFYHPRMPYTMGLLGSIPRIDQTGGSPLRPIEGNPPSPANLPSGCPFAARCPLVIDLCRTTEPVLQPHLAHGHQSACHRTADIEREKLGVTELFPAPELPESGDAAVPRDERPEVLRIDNLIKYYPLVKGAVIKREVGKVHAVDGIDIHIRAGETLGLVGESGCGKSTTLLEILQLSTPQSGQILIDGRNTRGLTRRDRRTMRRDLQVVFQDPLASLDPRLPVSDILAEPMKTHGMTKGEIGPRVRELLGLVGLDQSMASRYPQEFSGGQRQRVGIARALALTPKLLVLDEPVSALDVSVRAGVINLLMKLRAELSLSYLFVAHDLSVVRVIADRVAVMYLGRIVEVGEVESIYTRPSHPYTQALLSAIPIPDPRKERSRVQLLLEGDLPSPSQQLTGCRFRGRCFKYRQLEPQDQRRCAIDDPVLTSRGSDHHAACHFAEALEVV